MSHTRRRKLNRARLNLAAIRVHLEAAETQWADLLTGIGSGASAPGGEVADPTGNAAVSPSPARIAEKQFDEALDRLVAASNVAAGVVTRWAQTLPARAEELQRLEQQADPGCEVVARIKRKDGASWWEPEHRTTDLGGLLQRPYRLGRWAYDFARRTGRLPTKAETEAHLEGRRVKVAG